MASSDKELEQQLMEAGNWLMDPPSSVDELLPLLDQVENCLSRVEQSPSESMQNALSPSLKALITEQIFKNEDADVKVAVASCISEITRITAPDAPYDDDQMKEVFQLIVSSFENLSDKSSRSYSKRTSILETVAKVRSCVVMLDLECEGLIVEMFEHFLKAIRDYHPENVFSSMETIMNLVLEESEDISPELLSPVLQSVKKDSEEVLPIAQKLAERVLESCAAKLKPYLTQAVKNLGTSFDDYSKVVASICTETPGDVEQNAAAAEERAAGESKSEETPVEDAVQEGKEIPVDGGSAEQVEPANDKSPKSVVSNGIAQTMGDDSLVESNAKEHGHPADQPKNTATSGAAEPDGLDTNQVVNSEDKLELTTKKMGKKSSSSKSTEPSDSSRADEKEAETFPDNKSDSKEVPKSPHEGPSVDAAVSSKNEEETGVQPSSPKAAKGEAMDVSSPTPSGSLPDEGQTKKAGQIKKKESSIKESGVDDVSKASEGASDSEAKSKRSGRKAGAGISREEKTPAVVEDSKKETGSASDSETKLIKHVMKKMDASSNNVDGSSSKKMDDKKRSARGKAVSEKEATKMSAKKDDKEPVASLKTAKPSKDEPAAEETPKTGSKRKLTPGKEKGSGSLEYGENLVGSKVKVWWPKDRMYYPGVVDSYDSAKKKHKVLYVDGDQEILNLKRERWEFIGDSESDEEGTADNDSSHDASPAMPPKKKMKGDQVTKQVKVDASPKRVGGASSSKSKGAVTKLSGRKSRDDAKADGKSKDGQKTVSKSEDDTAGITKDHTPKSGRSVDAASKYAGKSKHDEDDTPKSVKSKDDSIGTPKASSRAKQDTPKTAKSKQETLKPASTSKGKPPKSSGKSNANGTGKSKSVSTKAREGDDMKENSTDSPKAPESVKGKTASSSKAQGSESRSGKKRRR